MTEHRKRYSKKQAEKLWQLVNTRIVEIRLAILQGSLDGRSARGQEAVIHNMLMDLPDCVVDMYKSKVSEP